MTFFSFLRDNRGVAALEFALVLPLLLALLLGGAGGFDLYRADRVTSNAANTVVDLAARQSSMDDLVRDALFATGRGLLGRYAGRNTFGVSITSINADSDGRLSVGWSEANANGSVLTDGNIASLELPEIPPNESVIFIRLENEYSPIFKSGITFNRDYVQRPRFVAQIVYDEMP